MRQSLADLCTLLQEQKVVLGNMLELAKQERQIIIAGQSDKLEDVIRLELKELNKLGAIERKRLELQKNIAAELGLPEGEITVTNIAEVSEPDEQDTIRALQKELMPIIEEHAAVNMENRELIKSHIDIRKQCLS